MNKSGKSVLWFLGACLALTQVVVTAVATNVSYYDIQNILIYSFISLFLILAVLLIIFFKYPELLLAQSEDLVSLVMIKEAVKDMNADLAKEIIMSFSASNWVKPEVDEVEEDIEDELEDEITVGEEPIEVSDKELEKEHEQLLRQMEKLVKSGS